VTKKQLKERRRTEELKEYKKLKRKFERTPPPASGA
jgi:hypothetical protein